ncbi:circadian clock protein PASD1 isoform X3 [Canis lupus baileyi]|uniref:circadian clock protein PASD1 isoform X3 n=1 Tax=Canis lupus familiaris TaxID=9615 RepID=UPI0003AE023B|nr:circadian clock protein PASD1 isoform X3 [Canis lupus familiaris]XP_025316518.1 circadian clock protein PASD1 isoform X3 [Canis lupus dingo]XP_038307038.1 circadian clock protein PASD1 isoform X3 [Canis lupus familiaris]|eukprot:XP_022271828.1 circadian clock protein PASD1 isoform X3 [Canis lupus familiaris]
MDETEREKEKRDVSNVSENKKKDQYNTFFTELRAMLQTHGYPIKGDRSKTSQGTTALSQKKKGTVNPETSRERSNWIPSFQSYEDFKCKTLQSLDGFMIILSTDGVIIFVAGNVTCLLGHLPNDLIGKKLLSLLPDNEKNEVYRKIALKLPLSSSVGKHIDFCCHFKRGDVEHSSSPTYEYVKFIITVKDISSEPLVLFSSFFPSHTYAESFPTYLPLEDRFYMVGSICLFKPQTLQELCAVNKAEDEVMLIQEDSNEEHVYPEYRIQGQRRSSRMESLRAAESVATGVSGDQASIVTVKQYGLQESVQIIKIQSDTSYNSSISSLESTAISPATSSLQSFELESSLEQIHDMDDADQMEKMEQVDEEEEVEWMVEKKVEQKSQVDRMEKDDQLDQVKKEEQLDEMKQDEQLEQQALSPSTVAANTTDQMQPTTSHHLATPESQSLGPVPKKQRTEWMKGPFSDLKEFKLSSGSCSSRSFKCPQELQEPCNTLNQASLQAQVPYVQQQFQQVHERHTQQPQQHHTLLGNHTLQVHLQGQANVAMPLYEEPMTFMQTQPTVLPVQLVAGQQPSGYYQNETLRGTEGNSHSFLPMEQQGVSRDPQPMVYNPSCITSFRRSPVNPESTLITLETPQDYIQLWQQPPDSQHHLYLQVNTWPSREQTTMQDQATWPQQVAALEAGSEAFQDPARYTPGQMSYFMSMEQSSLDQRQRQHQHQHQHQHQRYYRTEP